MSQRSDAKRNRDRILEVAYSALAIEPTASLNSIAKMAEVGPGTLYRHFPTREELVLTLYQQEVVALVDEVATILDSHEPLDAFRIWFRRLAEYVRMKHGLSDALHTAAAQQIVQETYAPVTGAVAQLVNSAQAAGTMRSDVDPDDVLTAMGFMWRVPLGEAGLAQADRVLELVIDGLRVQRTDSGRS